MHSVWEKKGTYIFDPFVVICFEETAVYPQWPLFSSVHSLSCVQLSVAAWTARCQAFLSITNTWRLLKLMSIESVMPSNHLFLCCPLLLLPSIFPSIRVFSNEPEGRRRWPNLTKRTWTLVSQSCHSGWVAESHQYVRVWSCLRA